MSPVVKVRLVLVSSSNLFNAARLMGATGNYFLDEALLKLDEPNIYPDRLLDAATELFDECWLPSIPDNVKFYVDYEKFARDCELTGDMVEFEFNGRTYTCTNAAGV